MQHLAMRLQVMPVQSVGEESALEKRAGSDCFASELSRCKGEDREEGE